MGKKELLRDRLEGKFVSEVWAMNEIKTNWDATEEGPGFVDRDKKEDFTDEALEKLMASLKKHGQVVPFIGIHDEHSNKVVAAGYRRFEAFSKLIDEGSLPEDFNVRVDVLKDITRIDAIQAAVIENYQRVAMTNEDMLRTVKRLRKELTVTDFIDLLGVSKSTIQRLVQVSKDEVLYQHVLDKDLYYTHAAGIVAGLKNSEDLIPMVYPAIQAHIASADIKIANYKADCKRKNKKTTQKQLERAYYLSRHTIDGWVRQMLAGEEPSGTGRPTFRYQLENDRYLTVSGLSKVDLSTSQIAYLGEAYAKMKKATLILKEAIEKQKLNQFESTGDDFEDTLEFEQLMNEAGIDLEGDEAADVHADDVPSDDDVAGGDEPSEIDDHLEVE